jgi:hypothetical protein
LRIGVDDQRLEPAARKRGREVDGGGGLADAPFLADDGENAAGTRR